MCIEKKRVLEETVVLGGKDGKYCRDGKKYHTKIKIKKKTPCSLNRKGEQKNLKKN